MSDTSTSIVPIITNYPDRERKAKEIVEWLIGIRAIKPDKTDCILSSATGYPINSGAKQLTPDIDNLPFFLKTNGLDLITERTVFHTGGNGIDSFVCPNCNEDILSEDWDFNKFHEDGNPMMICPLCKKESDLNNYFIEPAFGFSNLGFTFWNWPELNDSFIKEFERRLDCQVKVVWSHI